MSDSRQGPSRADSAAAGPEREHAKPQPATPSGPQNEAVLGPFTVRDLTVFGGVLIIFIGSLLPLVQRGGFLNLWNAQNLYFLAIGILLPLGLAGLFAWRRLAPEASIRIGSFSLDQFASIVAVLACSYFFLFAVTALSPGGIVGFVGGAVLVVATVFARVIPLFAGDFAGRPEVPAHVVARDAVRPAAKPKASAPAPSAAPAASAGGAAGGQQAAETGVGTPWAGQFTHDDGRTAGAESGPGISTAGAAAAASGVAGAAAAGAGVAALAAGALAAEEASSRGSGETTPRDHDEAPEGGTATPEEEPEPSGLAQLGMGEPIEPTADEAAVSPEAPAEAAGAPIAAESAAAASAGSPSQTAAAGSSEPGTAPAGAPVGAAADDAVVLGDADGESYGAPGAAEGVETGAGHTTVMPAASPGEAGTTPVTQAAPVVDRDHGFEATRSYEEDAPEYEAFWFAVSQQRTAVDPQSGLPLFTLEPGQWILALQDRGSEFLVQSQDGRVGLLRDLSGIERG